jgi:DNA polymerase-3 subunit alpha
MNDFVHLHVHSEYSLLDGLGRTADLAKEAARLGQPALALTDHGVMHGAIEFFRNCKKNNVKPIIGVEAYLTPFGRPMTGKDAQKDKARHHLLLLAQNMMGYKNLLKICSSAQLEGFYHKPRIDADFLAAHADGLICTTGCMAAEIPYLLNAEKQAPQEAKALERLRWYLDVFGRERFYVELQEHNIPELSRINKTLFEWSKQHELGLLVTNDVHYVNAADAASHDTLLCVQTNSLVTQTNRMKMTDHGYYLKSRAELELAFRSLTDLPESAFTNSLKIADMCEVDLEDGSFHLPNLPAGKMPAGFTYQTFLRYLTEEGLKVRYGARADSPEVQARKEHELKIISNMGFDIYYLIVWDLCEYARKRNIWWNVRGSGAGSIVAYATGITLIDPLKNNLIFERFLNPGRISMPDFDLDYPDDQREELIRYTLETYGKDHVAQIVSFGRMKARAAVRDVGRALDIPLSEVDAIAKQISAIPGKPVTIDDVLNPEHEFFAPDLKQQYETLPKIKELIDYARNLEGVARHSSVHAAAVIITDKPLSDYVPLMRATGNSVVTDSVTQFEFPICESIGLLKVDFLGLSTLTVMRKAAELIKERHGVSYVIENMAIDDQNWQPLDPKLGADHLKKAFALFASGNTTGVFQVEGQGMTNMLKEMRPYTFDHIVAAISLYRPGPMEYIPTYIKRMHGEEKVTFRHPKLEPILGETYSIIVYQEQIIRIASDLADYTPGEADEIRKAVSKKIKAKIDSHRVKFIDGCEKNTIPRTTAEAIWDDIEYFARYGFNKSHAADYGMVTCQTAYLKANYPIEYMTALLTVERNNTEKVSQLLTECRAIGIKVLPPHVNYSRIDFVIDTFTEAEPVIRFGMSAIKNVGEGPIEAILTERDANGFFNSLEDLCKRVDLRQVNRRALEGLIKAGALDCFSPDRALLIAVIDRMLNLSTSTHKAASAGQMSLFGGVVETASNAIESILDNPPPYDPVSRREILEWEKELVGTYLSEHPIEKNMRQLKAANVTMLNEITGQMHDRQITVAGVITVVKPHRSKKGDAMAFIEIEDMNIMREVVVFPRAYTSYATLLVEGNLVIIKGKVDAKDARSPKILADSISMELPKVATQANAKPEPPRPAVTNKPPTQQVAESRPVYQAMPPMPDEFPPFDESAEENPFFNEPHFDEPPMSEPPPPPIQPAPPVAKTPAPVQPTPTAPKSNGHNSSYQAAPQNSNGHAETLFNGSQSMTMTAPVVEAKVPPPIITPKVEPPLPAPITPPLADQRSAHFPAPSHQTTTTSKLEPKLPQPSKVKSDAPPFLITVRIQQTGDKKRDNNRLQTIVRWLSDIPGPDRFRLHVIDGQKEEMVDFPNPTTYSLRLFDALIKLFDDENAVRIDIL